MPEKQAQQGIVTQEEFTAACSGSDRTSREKRLSVLAYFSIFWLFGLLISPEKHKKAVRFHVGQGIALFIAKAAVLFIIGIGGGLLGKLIGLLTGISLADGFKIGDSPFLYPSIYSIALFLILFAAEITLLVLTIKGMLNAAKGCNNQLPIVGKRAFYK
ncbi:MAG: hypothetical protein LBT21_01120 [Oscillospiraceae bacterium]|jgi:uncharacterized membrane protein|nr:hypothetical protein [Oscillospiraceae bacterium]